jgi:hypothetical protein
MELLLRIRRQTEASARGLLLAQQAAADSLAADAEYLAQSLRGCDAIVRQSIAARISRQAATYCALGESLRSALTEQSRRASLCAKLAGRRRAELLSAMRDRRALVRLSQRRHRRERLMAMRREDQAATDLYAAYVASRQDVNA